MTFQEYVRLCSGFAGRPVVLAAGRVLAEGAHGYVIERPVSSETSEIEFDVDGESVLSAAQLEDFGAA